MVGIICSTADGRVVVSEKINQSDATHAITTERNSLLTAVDGVVVAK